MPSKAATAAVQGIQDTVLSKLIPDEDVKELLVKAETRVNDVIERGHLFDKKAEEGVVKFSENEVKVGKKLGLGGYCLVSEIGGFDLPVKNERPPLHSREYMAMQCIRQEGGPRYAIKELSMDTKSDKDNFLQGIADLVIEARLLSVIQHENIIKLRGIADCGYFNRDFFIVMDRLQITLDRQLVRWAAAESSSSCSCFSSQKNKQTAQDVLDEKLAAGLGISSALEHLHSKNIIYRDLKPDNLGFDVRDNVKLFDFGLSTEIDPSTADKDGTFKLTAFTGSPIYMAPEVAKGLPYNFKADVHSFGILLWQIMSNKMPFEKLTLNALEQFVVNGNHRPKPEASWSKSLNSLMQSCWDQDIAKRPDFAEVTSILQTEGYGEAFENTNVLDISTKSYTGLYKL